MTTIGMKYLFLDRKRSALIKLLFGLWCRRLLSFRWTVFLRIFLHIYVIHKRIIVAAAPTSSRLLSLRTQHPSLLIDTVPYHRHKVTAFIPHAVFSYFLACVVLFLCAARARLCLFSSESSSFGALPATRHDASS